nr:hypothetical protein CFP56_44084 [Quercus suber]
MLQSSDRVENQLNLADEVVSGKAKVSEHFEFSESVKLQLTGKCETFKDDNDDIARVCVVITFAEDAVPGGGTIIGVQRCNGSRVPRRNGIVGVAVDPFLEFKKDRSSELETK